MYEPDPNSIDCLNLNVRAFNALRNSGIHTIKELVCLSPFELLKIKNFGKASLKVTLDALEEKGLQISGEKPSHVLQTEVLANLFAISKTLEEIAQVVAQASTGIMEASQAMQTKLRIVTTRRYR